MSSPRYPVRDLSLERLGDRDGLLPAHLGETAQVRTMEGPAVSVREYLSAVHQALVDAAFTGPGAAAWLSGLQRRVAALLAGRDAARPRAAACDAIRAAATAPGRY
jgi:hypothetical protein